MTRLAPQKPTIAQLAKMIEQDIRDRGLKPGDEYLGQVETKRMLGVGTTSANRALQLLACRGVLVRKQRKGTFIGDLDAVPTDCPLRCVHLVMDRDHRTNESYFADGTVLGIQEVLPSIEVVFSFLPVTEQAEFAENLVHNAMGTKELSGFVLASSTFPVQKAFMGSGLPVVVAGGLYPTISGMSWIDSDHAAEAALVVKHMVTRGCQRFLLLSRQRTLPGEQVFLDEFARLLGEAGVSHGDVLIRNLPSDAGEIDAHLTDALSRISASGQKWGINTRTEPIVRRLDISLQQRGLDLGKQVELVASNLHSLRKQSVRFPYVARIDSPEETGRRLGECLKRLAERKAASSQFREVKLLFPDQE